MTWFKMLAVFSLLLCLGASPALAQVTQTGGTRTLSPGDTIQSGSTSSSSAAAAAAASAEQGQQQSNTNVFVPTNVNTNQQGQAQHQGQQQGQAQGQRQSQNNKQVIAPSQTINEGDTPAQAPAVFAPNLTSSPEACMGSVSAGGGAGFAGTSFGLTFGTTWTNQECQDRMNVRTLSALGQNQAALEYYAAANPKIADALKKANVKMAAAPAPVVAAAPVVEQGGTKVEKKDVAQAALPMCGDGKPAKLRGAMYSCWGWDR